MSVVEALLPLRSPHRHLFNHKVIYKPYYCNIDSFISVIIAPEWTIIDRHFFTFIVDSLDGQYDPWHYLPQQADIDCSYIGEDYDDIDSLNELLILCKDDDVITCTQSCPTGITIDFEDFVAFRASLAEGQAVRDESSISNNTSPILSDIKTAAYPVEERSQAWAQSTSTVPVTIHDIPFIMSQLPCCLQNRFLERFAESAGLQYAEAITIRGIISPQGSVDGHVSPDDFRSEKALSQRMSPYGKPTSMEPTMRKECFLLDPL